MTPFEQSLPLCACGCGDPVRTRRNRFIHGHQAAKRPVAIAASPFKIAGVYCRLIPLSNGFYAIVDEQDYWWLIYWAWQCRKYKQTYYAVRRAWVNGKKRTFYMHREIAKTVVGLLTDHRSGIGLDNRRGNLRPADYTQSAINTDRPAAQYGRGIKKLPCGNFYARLKLHGKEIGLGSHPRLEDAQAARKAGEIKYFGEWARNA